MRKYHILICDDEAGVRESLKAYLEETYELSFAKNGQEAINFVGSYDFDLIIIDIKLPLIDGIEVIKRIKEFKPEQKIIVLTGYESISVAKETARHGIGSYLTKPVGKDKLLLAVTETLK